MTVLKGHYIAHGQIQGYQLIEFSLCIQVFEVLYDYANIRNKSGLINGTEESRGLEPVLKSVGPKHPLHISTSV